MPRAPRRCPGDDYHCPNTIRSGKYCPNHTTSWQGRTTGQGRYVSPKVKAAVRARDKTCRLNYPVICTGAIDEMDHPDGLAATGKPRTSVLTAGVVQGVCRPCHRRKTQQQARAGRNGWKRQAERHPGLL
jgi:hypothetical protein